MPNKLIFSREKFLLTHSLYYKANPILRASIDRMNGEEVVNGICCGYGLIPRNWCDEVTQDSYLRQLVKRVINVRYEKGTEEKR